MKYLFKEKENKEILMEPSRKGDWIQTFSGVHFYSLDPRPEEIRLVDIAHALSMQCRFTGHTSDFYSVAQHSLYVSQICDPVNALWGLLHDASEAYLVDVARPVKLQPEMLAYREAENRLMACITKRFNLLSPTMPPDVHAADQTMLGAEAAALMKATDNSHWAKWMTPAAVKIRVVPISDWRTVRGMFIDRAMELGAR